MYNIKMAILIMAIAIVVCSWKNHQDKLIKKMEWLIGTWENKTQKGSIYETWQKIDDTELSGKSYVLRGKDTIIFENIRIAERQGNLLYIPSVKNQNNGQPVSFTLNESSLNTFVFKNTEHDFPQVISYNKITPDSLLAEISGTKNGQFQKRAFPMKKITHLN